MALLVLVSVSVWWKLYRLTRDRSDEGNEQSQATTIIERLERTFRTEIGESQRGGRQELQLSLQAFQQAQSEQMQSLQRHLSGALSQELSALSDLNSRRISEVRATLDAQLQQLQQTNATKLDDMRRVVDEKLQTTLEQGLSSRFKEVADRLEQVHRGLGQMQNLALNVGDLQRVLTNVKTRGVFGEIQLGRLLEQVLTVDQYRREVSVRPGSMQRVDFAVRFPGRAEGEHLWMPIDAKFPRGDYDRLLDAQERGDTKGVESASRGLETRLRLEAKRIQENYLEPPHTTEFAVLFLPTESLYAEALRRPDLLENLQRDYRVTLAGPTTLLAMLNSFQLGFRTLALEKKASEVWEVLARVRTEFERYGEWVGKVRDQVHRVSETLDRADTRHNQMQKVLKNVQRLSVDSEAVQDKVGGNSSD